jgi:NADH-quinone oxidoreductase subunit F
MGKKEIIAKSDYIITFGSFLASDNEIIKDSIIQAIAKNSAEFIYMHPVDNVDLRVYYSQIIKYEVGSEEGITALLLDTFIRHTSSTVQEYINDLDIGYISAESSAGEEEFEEALEKLADKEEAVLIVGRDIVNHPRVENIIKMLSVLNKYSKLTVLALDETVQSAIQKCVEELDEIEELASYNGTVIYTTFEKENEGKLIGSESFARVAKVSNKDKVFINFNNEKIKKDFVIDKDLYGMVALCALNSEDSTSLSQGYRFKQVKIEKVDE